MKTTIKCPGCGNALEVEEEWNGCKAECPYCANKFILRLEEPLRSVAPDLTQQQNDFLLSLGCTVIVSRGHVYADISSYDPQTSMKLVMRLTGIGIQFLDRYDHDTGKYKTLAVAGEVWSASGGTWKLLSVSKKKEASDAVLQSALLDLRQRIESTVASFSISNVFAEVECPYFKPCSSKEKLLWYGQACQDCGDGSKECSSTDYYHAKQLDGLLCVSTERVVFVSAAHRQEYKISSLRTVKTNWHDYCGSLIVGSSVRKMEKYIANEIWKPALIILVQWNEFFGMKFQQCDKRNLASDLCESICRPCAVAGKQGVEYDCLPEDVIELEWKRCNTIPSGSSF